MKKKGKYLNGDGHDGVKVLSIVKTLICALLTFFFTSTIYSITTVDAEQPPLPLNTFNQTIRNRNHEVFEEYSRRHVLVKSNTAITCAAENMQLLRGDVLPENYKYDMILLLKQEPQYYSLCLGDDSHQHTVEFTLEHGQCDILVSVRALLLRTVSSVLCHNEPLTSFFIALTLILYHAKLFLCCVVYVMLVTRQASGALPRKDFWDWKLNSRLSRKSLAIHTFAPEILRSNDKNLHIGIVSSNSGGACSVGIKISMFNDEELLPKLGLRGGRVMTKRDLVH